MSPKKRKDKERYEWGIVPICPDYLSSIAGILSVSVDVGIRTRECFSLTISVAAIAHISKENVVFVVKKRHRHKWALNSKNKESEAMF